MANPTLCNPCLGFTDISNYKKFRPARGSKDWGKQGIYAIMEDGFTYYGKKKPILYVSRGKIGECLEKHFKGTDGQKIGKHLSDKNFQNDQDRLKLRGIKVYWKPVCVECNKKREKTFIKCVEDSLGYRPPYNRIAGSS